MKILLTHRYFWPDVAPYGQLLRSIATDLAAYGHEVHVFTARPSYRNEHGENAPKHQVIDGVNITRCQALKEQGRHPIVRVANAAYYCFCLFFKIIALRPDIVAAATFPPVVAALVACIAAQIVNAKFVYHVQDIHPEVSSLLKPDLSIGFVARFLRWLDNQTLQRAAAIIVLSEDMAVSLRSRTASNLPIHVMNNFGMDDGAKLDRPSAQYLKQDGKRRIVFAGNLGRFQNLPALATGVVRCLDGNPDLELLFLGDGVALKALKDAWEEHPQVQFAPFLPSAQARYLISEADVGLVSLAQNIHRVAYPSKTLTYLSLGVPVLAMVNPESHLAKDLAVAGVAWVPESEQPEDIAIALNRLLDTNVSREKILDWYGKTFGREAYIRTLQTVLGDVACTPFTQRQASHER